MPVAYSREKFSLSPSSRLVKTFVRMVKGGEIGKWIIPLCIAERNISFDKVKRKTREEGGGMRCI